MIERLRAVISRHWLFLGLLAAGLALRIAAAVAYYPALVFYGDSLDYLKYARAPQPYWFHPLGYSLFLWPFVRGGAIAPIPVAQHLLGLGLAIGIYAALLRLRLPRLWSAVATAPFLLDASFIVLEQNILAETCFMVLMLGALALLLLPARLSWRHCAGAGALLAAATLFRTIGLVVVVAALVIVLARRSGWRALVATVAAAAVPLVGYASWYAADWGSFALEGSDARLQYGRLAVFVRCSEVHLPVYERPLCPTEPLSRRHTVNYYTWDPKAPVLRFVPPPGRHIDPILSDFNHRVEMAQPLAYAASIADYTWRYLAMTRLAEPPDYQPWTFDVRPPYSERIARSSVARQLAAARWHPSRARSPAGALRAYGRFALVPGPVVLLGLLLSAGALAAGRRVPAGRRRAIAGLAGTGLLLLVGSAATTAVDPRYLVPVVATVFPAGVLAAESIGGTLRRAGPGGGRSPTAAPPTSPRRSRGSWRPASAGRPGTRR